MLDNYDKHIQIQIEEMRWELNNLVEKKFDNMVDYDVIELSQKLDRLLLQYIKTNKKIS